MGEVFKKDIPVVAPEFRVSRSAAAPIVTPGLSMKSIAIAVFDTAVNDSAGASNKAIGAHGLGVYLPNKAVITDVWYDVTTTFVSATDAATIAMSVQSAGDMTAALAISNASNIWDAGLRGSVLGTAAIPATATAIVTAAANAASMLKLTAEREITATVAVEVLTAGKMTIYIEYFLGA